MYCSIRFHVYYCPFNKYLSHLNKFSFVNDLFHSETYTKFDEDILCIMYTIHDIHCIGMYE